MITNYIKIAFRNLLQHKVYGAINIFGLAIGVAVAMIIGLWVYHEYSYDKFLPGHEQVYQVRRNFDSNGEILNFNTTSLKLADALRHNIPEIQSVVVTDWMGEHGLIAGEKKLYIRGGIVENGFLQMFQFPLLKGTTTHVLQDPFSIVLTASLAKALFGQEDAMNKTVRFDNSYDLKVTGILEDIPANSSFSFNYLVPFSYLEQTNPGFKSSQMGSFGNNSFQQFVQLKSGISLAHVAPKVSEITHSEKESTNAMKSFVVLQPLSRWHLFSTYINGKDKAGFIDYIRIFSLIAVLVLVIACINFINLTTARSEKRAREVGVRKAIGSRRRDLIFQFLTESLVLTILAFIVAFILVQLSLPFFNRLTGKEVKIPIGNPVYWLIIAGAILLTALASGGRPALYLSSFQPVKVLKGNLQIGKSGSLPRKIMVVIQFSCSIALIISTVVVYQQIQFVKNRPIGFNTHQLIMTDLNGDLAKNYTALKNDLLEKGLAESVTMSSSPATNIYWHSDIDQWPGKNAGETIEMATIIVSTDYFKTLGIEFSAGHDFATVNDSTQVIFNEAAIRQMRIKDPLSQTITWNEQKFNIIGVIKNALIASPFLSAEPTMFLISPNAQGNLSYRLSQKLSTEAAIGQLAAIFAIYNPSYPFNYRFADSSYAEKFNLEILIGKLAGIFASLTIFISCLGLFGLAAFIGEQRTKEIGIRKVLGASVAQVWFLLTRDFILLVLLSCFIAIPVALYFLQNWLDSYSYRIKISPAVFLLSGAVALVITLLTISYQSIKAALINPVRSLKSE